MSIASDLKTLNKSLRGQVFASTQGIKIIKKGVSQPVTVVLEPAGRDKYNLKFPTYTFVSRISHFSPKEEERRLCRNKTVLFSVIRDLKKVGIWGKVQNKDFLQVNPNFKKTGKKDRELQEVLKDVTGSK